MNLEIIKELPIEGVDFYYNGTLVIVGSRLHVKQVDTEGNEKTIVLTLGDLIKLAVVMKDFIEKHPEVKTFEKPRVELSGSINYNKDTDTAVMKGINTEYPMDIDDLEKIHYMLTLATPELKMVDEYVKDIKDFIEEKKIKMKDETGYDFEYVDPSFDVFQEWFLDWTGIFKIGHDRYSYRIPDSWMMQFADKIREAVVKDLGISPYGFNDYGYDNKFIERIGSNSIFFIQFDEFKTSPYRTAADRYANELKNEVLGNRIPSGGKSSDMAAELVSNLNYTLYRWYNDGDIAEDLVNHPNAVVMANILQYIDDLSTYDSMIFKYFYGKAIRMVFASNQISADKCPTLSDLEKYIEENSDKFRGCGYYGDNLPDEIKKKIAEGTFSKDDANEYYYEREYRFDPDNSLEFILNEAVPYLITIMLILKVYPDWLKGCEVKDLRCRYFKASNSSSYDW